MDKLKIYIIVCLVFIIMGPGYGSAGSDTKQSEGIDTENEVLSKIELGTADADTFASFFNNNKFTMYISHSAIANYMEGLANEGMLGLIPIHYLIYNDVRTALDVVFEDFTNIVNNWDVFQNVWLPYKICH